MLPARGDARPLDIRRYPNRRYYDATNSRHVSLTELYELVGQGFDLAVTDSASGTDITPAVLTQMILDRDSEKLAIFPAPILHQIIRTQTQFLGGIFENFLRQTLEAQRSTQDQWARFLQQALPPGIPTPPTADWMRSWWASQPAQQTPVPPAAAPPSAASPIPAAGADEVSVLRSQLAELMKRVDELSRK